MANDCKGLEDMVLNEKSPGEVEYLKKSLGPALVAGLAEVCMQKPANPVEYLADWLLRRQTNGEDHAIRRGVQTRSTQTTPDLHVADLPISGNPFLVDHIFELMAKKTDVNTLKTLRKMNIIWNQFALENLEKRALKNQLREIDLTKKWFLEEELVSFLEATAAIPQLFHSFRIKFPNSIDPNFFKKCSPMFLHLGLEDELKFTDRLTKDLHNLFIWMAPTLQELEVSGGFEAKYSSNLAEVVPFNPSSVDGHPLVFHKLTKLVWKLMDFETGILRNSFAPFKAILDKSGRIDPTSNLTRLEVSTDEEFNQIMDISQNHARWSQLTHLRIGECGEDAEGCRFARTLLSLGQAGMTLKMFALTLDFDCPPEVDSRESLEICQHLSAFFATQAKSLEVLEFTWYFGESDASEEDLENPKIQLPIFESLQTLHFNLGYNGPQDGVVQTSIFGRIRVHFPKLDHLHVNHQGFLNLFPLDGEPIPLKSLDIDSCPKNLQAVKFPPSVESLTCKSDLFKAFSESGAELPWKESLKVLEIDGVTFPLKVAHLTSLRKLIVRESTFLGKFELYLAFFRQVPDQLSSITFKSCEEPCDYVKSLYVSHFLFPVKFEKMPFKNPNYS